MEDGEPTIATLGEEEAIVTELVINALKHAFPGERIEHIHVDYDSHDRDWTLSVSEDGVGMPALSSNIQGGLGSNLKRSRCN